MLWHWCLVDILAEKKVTKSRVDWILAVLDYVEMF